MYCDSLAMILLKCLHVLFCIVEPLLGLVLSLTNFCVSYNKQVTWRWRDWPPISKVQLSLVLMLSWTIKDIVSVFVYTSD